MTTILVTGANGFVGLNIVQRLAQKGARVVALARRPPDPDTLRFLAEEAAQVEWVECDVRDRSRLIELAGEHGVERIVHAAAMTPSLAVERSQPTTVMDVNLGGVLNALEAARDGESARGRSRSPGRGRARGTGAPQAIQARLEEEDQAPAEKGADAPLRGLVTPD